MGLYIFVAARLYHNQPVKNRLSRIRRLVGEFNKEWDRGTFDCFCARREVALFMPVGKGRGSAHLRL